MICSVCKKNPAIIFINKIENNQSTVEGLCFSCAKEKGLNPIEILGQSTNISKEEMEQLTEQFSGLMDELSENIDINIDSDEFSKSENNPFGSLLNIFKNSTKENADNSNTNNESNTQNSNKKVKVEKKSKNNKKRFLDTFGTNLTQKAKDNLIDEVIGRDQEIERVLG